MNASRKTVGNTRTCLRGFTLIEVLVVVAIIALLISILMPSLSAARRQARVVVCGSNLSSLGKSTMYYAQASKDELPAGWGYNGNVVNANVIGLNPWEFLYNFVQKAAPKPGSAPFATGGWLLKVPTYTCPDDQAKHTTSQRQIRVPDNKGVYLLLSYGANLNPMYAKRGDVTKGAGRLSTIKRASDLTSYFDSGDDGNADFYGYNKGNDPYGVGWILNDCIASSQPNNQCVFEVHHKSGNNFAFYDGHVGFYKVGNRGPHYGLPPTPGSFLVNWNGIGGAGWPSWANDPARRGFRRPVSNWFDIKSDS